MVREGSPALAFLRMALPETTEASPAVLLLKVPRIGSRAPVGDRQVDLPISTMTHPGTVREDA